MGKPSQDADPLIGQVVGGRFEVVRLIGKGGMGAIYEIRNTRLGRSFALKTLIGEAAEDAEVIARFRREADVIAKIKHPNIVEVIDWEILDDGSPAMVLEYLKGEDLSARIREAAPLTWPFIGRIGDQILGALSTAHAAGVVHRDLKPQNVFLASDDSGEEKAKLLDFGVSKIRDSRSLVTTDARLLGTPSYMSPEQAEGRTDDIGPATDLWAMGAILYEMATGELAFDGASMPAVLYKICSREADAVNLKRADAPPAYVQLVREALARNIEDRITDADVFRVRLREVLREVAGLQYTDRIPRLSTPPPSRRKRYTGANDQTVQSGNMKAVAPEPPAEPSISTATPTGVGQVSASTLMPPKRSPALLLGLGGVIAAMLVVVIVLATRKPGTAEDNPQPVSAHKSIAPAETIDAGVAVAPPDAAVAVIPVDAAIAAVKKDPPKKDPPKRDPPKQDPPKQDPPKQDPPKPPKKCPIGDKECEFLQGGGQ